MYRNDTAFIFQKQKRFICGCNSYGQVKLQDSHTPDGGVRGSEKKTTFHEQSITKPMWQLQRRLTQHEPSSILIRIACTRMSFHIKPNEIWPFVRDYHKNRFACLKTCIDYFLLDEQQVELQLSPYRVCVLSQNLWTPPTGNFQFVDNKPLRYTIFIATSSFTIKITKDNGVRSSLHPQADEEHLFTYGKTKASNLEETKHNQSGGKLWMAFDFFCVPMRREKDDRLRTFSATPFGQFIPRNQ